MKTCTNCRYYKKANWFISLIAPNSDVCKRFIRFDKRPKRCDVVRALYCRNGSYFEEKK